MQGVAAAVCPTAGEEVSVTIEHVAFEVRRAGMRAGFTG
jgi:hypothetical protein